MNMKFGPIKKPIKHLLVFFAQNRPKWHLSGSDSKT